MKKNRIITIIVIAIAISFIAVGIAVKDYSVVLTKAINICTECIGIG